MGIYNLKEENLLAAYPRYHANDTLYNARITRVVEGFEKQYNRNNPRIFSAPGRTEIGGNHTDHQQGCVLAAAVDMDILATALPNDTSVIRILSEGFEPEEIDISHMEIEEDEKNTSSSLIRGMAAKMTEMGHPIRGFDMYAISSVLKGSGVSSSAAYEVLLGTVMNELFCEGYFTPVQIAQIGQYAENVYFGKLSGLMDQTAASVGGIVAIDFKDNNNPIVEKLDFDFTDSNYSVCIVDSGADHADLSDQYSAIPVEMKEVAKMLGATVLREASEEEFQKKMPEIRTALGDRAVFRALHFFRENRKAQEEARALNAGDFQEFLRLVNASGMSSLMYLQNVSVEGSVKNQEVLYALALCDILLDGKGAFRVHGGGFAGTVQAFVPNEMVEEFVAGIEALLGKGACHVVSIRMAGGVELQ
ncbi:MAG: galactokinase family protein [Eubacteriales bacterium]